MTTHMTKTWFDGKNIITQEIPQAEIYKREWVGLTNKELFEIMDKANTRYQAVQMTQAKLRELNAPQIDPNQWAFDNGLEST